MTGYVEVCISWWLLTVTPGRSLITMCIKKYYSAMFVEVLLDDGKFPSVWRSSDNSYGEVWRLVLIAQKYGRLFPESTVWFTIMAVLESPLLVLFLFLWSLVCIYNNRCRHFLTAARWKRLIRKALFGLKWFFFTRSLIPFIQCFVIKVSCQHQHFFSFFLVFVIHWS